MLILQKPNSFLGAVPPRPSAQFRDPDKVSSDGLPTQRVSLIIIISTGGMYCLFNSPRAARI